MFHLAAAERKQENDLMQLGKMQWGTLEYIFAIFAIATAIGVLLQAGILLGFFIAFVKLRGKLEKILYHVTEHALPMIERSKVMLEDLSPKVTAISANLVEVSDMLKDETPRSRPPSMKCLKRHERRRRGSTRWSAERWMEFPGERDDSRGHRGAVAAHSRGIQWTEGGG